MVDVEMMDAEMLDAKTLPSREIAVTIPLQKNLQLGSALDDLPAGDLERAWGTVGGGEVEALEEQPSRTVKDPEGHRKTFVSHEGKKVIKIRRWGFVKGSRQNDWVPVLDEFVEKIGDHIGKDKVQCLSADFSTSGAKERAVAAVTLMDTVQHYFEYEFLSLCGFPSITLTVIVKSVEKCVTSSLEDWKRIREKAEQLQQYGLDWWLEVLLPVLDQFAAAADNRADPHFWNSLCNVRGMSCEPGSPLTGWIQAFFPYLNAPIQREEVGTKSGVNKSENPVKMSRNSSMDAYKRSYENGINLSNFTSYEHLCGHGVDVEEFPPGVASAPFVYEDVAGNTGSYNMKFMGGVACIVQDQHTRAVRPELSWGIVDLGKV